MDRSSIDLYPGLDVPGSTGDPKRAQSTLMPNCRPRQAHAAAKAIIRRIAQWMTTEGKTDLLFKSM